MVAAKKMFVNLITYLAGWISSRDLVLMLSLVYQLQISNYRDLLSLLISDSVKHDKVTPHISSQSTQYTEEISGGYLGTEHNIPGQ